MTRPFLVGLTGGLASGKSTVASLLAEAGCRVVDADRLVAELYRPGQPGAEAVRELFGPEALTPEGAVDPPKVAARVFRDPEARQRLEEVVHPLVRRRFRDIAETEGEAGGIVVLEATLLVEAGYVPDFDWVVTVEAPREARLQRAVARGLSPEDARARLDAQGDGAARRAAAQRVIDNDGSLEDLRLKVADLVTELRGMAPDPARAFASPRQPPPQ
jgi:dephospho-CoA kinase